MIDLIAELARLREDDHYDELEHLNKEFNERMAARPVTDLVQCPECRGCGYAPLPDFEVIQKKCHKCRGIGYVDNST
jgi:predicted Zn-ribbon and HTH transcriptional regulator